MGKDVDEYLTGRVNSMLNHCKRPRTAATEQAIPLPPAKISTTGKRRGRYTGFCFQLAFVGMPITDDKVTEEMVDNTTPATTSSNSAV